MKYAELTHRIIGCAMEVHRHRRSSDSVTYQVHWKRTSFAVWKRKYVPRRGLTYFVVSSAEPWRIIDVYGDEFF